LKDDYRKRHDYEFVNVVIITIIINIITIVFLTVWFAP